MSNETTDKQLIETETLLHTTDSRIKENEIGTIIEINESENVIENSEIQESLPIKVNKEPKPRKAKRKTKGSTKINKKLTKTERQARYQQLLQPCDICGKMLEKSRLEAHKNQHLGIKPYNCDVQNCDRQFYSQYLIAAHKRMHHSKNSYQCSQCENTYSLQKSLYNHEQKHKEPRYDCEICGRKYKNG